MTEGLIAALSMSSYLSLSRIEIGSTTFVNYTKWEMAIEVERIDRVFWVLRIESRPAFCTDVTLVFDANATSQRVWVHVTRRKCAHSTGIHHSTVESSYMFGMDATNIARTQFESYAWVVICNHCKWWSLHWNVCHANNSASIAIIEKQANIQENGLKYARIDSQQRR